MAWFDDYSTPAGWSNDESRIWDSSFGDTAIRGDQMAQALFDAALFDHDMLAPDRAAVHVALRSYFYEHYDIDFNEEMDWHAYKEWYENNV